MADTERCIHCGRFLYDRDNGQPYGHAPTCLLHPTNIAQRAAELEAEINATSLPVESKSYLHDLTAPTFDKAFPQFAQPILVSHDAESDADRRAVVAAILWGVIGFCAGMVLMYVLTWIGQP